MIILPPGLTGHQYIRPSPNYQLFATVGISTKNGDLTKFRFTNRGAEAYGDILVKEGHTNVQFIDLGTPLSKADAVAEFVKQFPDYAELRVPGVAADKPVRAPKTPKAAKEPRAPRAKKVKSVELTAEQIAAAKAAAKRATDAARKRAARAAVKLTDTADANLDAALAALDAATAETTEG
jgi:hypothetical protein